MQKQTTESRIGVDFLKSLKTNGPAYFPYVDQDAVSVDKLVIQLEQKKEITKKIKKKKIKIISKTNYV